MPSKLGYWDIRGVCGPVRLFLHYIGEDYEEVYYKFGKGPHGPGLAKENWRNVKHQFGLDFPNIPYYIDDKVKLSHSMTILRYLSKKYNLGGTTDAENIKIDLAGEEYRDLRDKFHDLCYSSPQQFENEKKTYVKDINEKLVELETFLGDRQWIAGDTVTYADFCIYDILDMHRILYPDFLQNFPKLTQFLQRVEELPKIKAYIASDSYIRRPLYAPRAAFR